jgi:transposase-like protein
MSDIQNAAFHDDDKAREALEAIRWPDGPVCPHCGNSDQEKIAKAQGKAPRPGLYYCAECNGQFTVTVGTVMERSKVPLSKWLFAMHLMGASKKGMSALQLQRMLGVTYKTAWFLCHRIREAMMPTTRGPLGGEGKTVEADETYIGGKEKNKHVGQRKRGNIGGKGKMAVFALVERDGESHSFRVANVTGKTLRPLIVTHADRNSSLMTDEGMKRAVYGTHHSISEAHLPRYLAEWDFKWNTRKTKDGERAALIAKGIAGKRLTYRPPH